MSDEEDDMDLETRSRLQGLESKAAKLRERIINTAGEAHCKFWSGRGSDGNGYLDDRGSTVKDLKLEPADITEFLKGHDLMQHPIATDGKCQYRALSRALFGSEEFHKQLLEIAVEHLKLHKDKYCEQVTATELKERRPALRKLVEKGLIKEADYDGWRTALELGLEWGNDFTLKAICKVLHVNA